MPRKKKNEVVADYDENGKLITAVDSDVEVQKVVLTPSEDAYYKSNFLIGAKYESELMENKIIAISLSRSNEFIDDDGKALVSVIPGNELRHLLGGMNSNSFYERLAITARSMTQRSIGTIDPTTQKFDFLTLVIRASYNEYDDKNLRIYYNPYMKAYLTDFKKNFTKLSLTSLLNFKKNSAYRLYEVLEKDCQPANLVRGSKKEYRKKYGLGELNLLLGLSDANGTKASKNILQGKGKKELTEEDYVKAIAKSEKKHYTSWSLFKQKLLDPAIIEINGFDKDGLRNSNLLVMYDTIKSGKGGKITHVIFTIEKLSDEDLLKCNEKTDISEEEKLTLYQEIKSYILSTINPTVSNIHDIAEAGRYNKEYIKSTCEAANQKYMNKEITSYIGWVLVVLQRNIENIDNSKTEENPSNNRRDIENEGKFDIRFIVELSRLLNDELENHIIMPEDLDTIMSFTNDIDIIKDSYELLRMANVDNDQFLTSFLTIIKKELAKKEEKTSKKTGRAKKVDIDILMKITDKIQELLPQDLALKTSDYAKIAEAADYEMDIIERAIAYYNKKKARGNIVNDFAYIISVIQNRYFDSSSFDGSKVKEPDFEQNSYDYEQLEKDLMKN
ncbi:replication initiation protein [Butyrivibrio fibrisolvens]|uniref:replication initiation protein n=1 Tax=Butyrivibrio fibrisolvens TaxID=831 RepID=UPI0003B2E8A8|nr:replication initiation protein [Butyrivibrio fibrisolvens]